MPANRPPAVPSLTVALSLLTAVLLAAAVAYPAEAGWFYAAIGLGPTAIVGTVIALSWRRRATTPANEAVSPTTPRIPIIETEEN